MRFLQKKIEKEIEDRAPDEEFRNIRKLDANFNEVTDSLRKAMEDYVEVVKGLKDSDDELKEAIAEIDRDFALWEDNPLKPRLWNSPLYYMLKEWKDKLIRILEKERERLAAEKEALNGINKFQNVALREMGIVDEKVRLQDEMIEYYKSKKELEGMVMEV